MLTAGPVLNIIACLLFQLINLEPIEEQVPNKNESVAKIGALLIKIVTTYNPNSTLNLSHLITQTNLSQLITQTLPRTCHNLTQTLPLIRHNFDTTSIPNSAGR